MNKIQTAAAPRVSFTVDGMIGSFSPHGEDRVTVNFFSTVANRREDGSGATRLLRELMPMRERLTPSSIRDLDTLLQRDLNDARVAHELVPYLKGQTGSGIAFFPAILGALMPKGFIEGKGGPYPEPDEAPGPDGNPTTTFGSCWSLMQFTDGDGKPLPLGRLTVYPSDTDVVVLDGQHRANAFRYVTGVFGQESSFYGAFYDGEPPVEDFDADLPVTLVWFTRESGDVDPTLISRGLFVDVNTTAKKVNRSRNILLDDREVPSLLTRFFLSATAESASFEPGRFSLLHSGFDVDSDLADRAGHALTLTNPDLLEYALSWLTLGSYRYSGLDRYRVSAEHKRRSRAQFEQIFDTDRFNWTEDIVAPDHADTALLREEGHDEGSERDSAQRFKAEYGELLHPVLKALFNGFPLYQLHYEACESVAGWVPSRSSEVQEVWRLVFNGGEGLYYSLQYYADPSTKASAKPSARIHTYLTCVRQIEKEFERDRAARLVDDPTADDVSRVSQAYESLRTRAFQVGLLMALNAWRRQDEELRDALPSFLDRVRSRPAEDWFALMDKVKPALLPNVDPKSWPAYQNLLLRVLQDAEHPFYSAQNFGASPDGQMFADRVGKLFSAWLETDEDIDPRHLSESDLTTDLVRSWALTAREYVDGLMGAANVAPLDGVVDYEEEARRIANGRVRKLKTS